MEIQEKDDGIGLLDVLLVLAQNVKLIAFGSLLAGLIALGVSYVLPQSFVSQSVIALPPATATISETAAAKVGRVAAVMGSAIVLDPVIQSLGLAQNAPIEKVRDALAGQVRATLGKDGLLHLDVAGKSPQEAQVLANAVIDAWLKSTVPSEQERQVLEKRLAIAQNGLKTIGNMLRSLDVQGAMSILKSLGRGEVGADLATIQTLYMVNALYIPSEIQGVTRDVVKQSPSLPMVPSGPNKKLIVVISTLGACFVMLLFVFMRQAWRNGAKDAETAHKQVQLLRALGFR